MKAGQTDRSRVVRTFCGLGAFRSFRGFRRFRSFRGFCRLASFVVSGTADLQQFVL